MAGIVKRLLFVSLGFVSVVGGGRMMGCATLVTTTQQPSTGIVYYLPMKLVKVTLTRKAVPTDALKVAAADLEKAKGAAQEAGTRHQTAKGAAEWADKTAKAAEAAKPGSPMALKARETADLLAADAVTAKEALAEVSKKQASLQAVYDNLVLRGDGNKFEDEIALAELPAIPDPQERYVAKLSHWITHADTLKIGTTESGLLKTVSGTSTDKTGAILEDTAKAIIAGLKASVGLPGRAPSSTNLETPDPCVLVPAFATQAFTYEYTLNPSDSTERTTMNCTLQRLGSTFRISAKKVSDVASGAPKSGTASTTTAATVDVSAVGESASCHCVKGLVYRRPVRWEFSIEKVSEVGKPGVPIRTTTILLPNEGPAMVASMETSPFIATSYDIAFQDGMLTKWDVDRPSELYAIIQIPLNVLKDLIALPTQLIQLKLDYSSKDADLLKAQKAQVEAADALKKAVESSSGASAGTNSTNQ